MAWLVIGMGVTGEAVARALQPKVVVVEDRPGERSRARAAAAGVELIEAPGPDRLEQLVAGAEGIVVSPGVAPHHPVFAAAALHEVTVLSEVELAYRSATMPIVAVTGTNGKTTVTTMVAAMLVETGLRAVAAGNIGLPLIDAIGQDVNVVVAEVSSFQLELTDQFRAPVAAWLNLAEDHLDWHPDLAHYARAKEKVWANQHPADLAVANAEDAVVAAAAGRAPGRVERFGIERGDWRAEGGWLVGPAGKVLPVTDLRRALPHDVANALAAVATAVGAGASIAACATVLARFESLPHRVTLVGDAGGVRFYDDSKATTPASVVAALAGFESVVLIAGGRNKGLDLSVLRAEVGRIRSVVAIGEAAGEVEAAFAGTVPVERARSMDDAVAAALALALPGDAVLLSPGCASFDWYQSYAERGDDFARAVREQVA